MHRNQPNKNPIRIQTNKKSAFRISLSIWGILLLGCTGGMQDSLKYLKQQPPSTTPEIFAPGLISLETEYEFGSVFNKEGTEFFYGVDLNGKSEIRYSKLEGEQWSKPRTILVHDRFGYNDPFLSPDEKRLYFISRRAMDGEGKAKDYDIWYSERKGDTWSAPINAGPNINSSRNEYYISFSQNGTMYFSSNKRTPARGERNDFDIYYSKSIDGEFQKPVNLGKAINTKHYEADVFIDPNESYIIFCATRPDGLGEGDLYISFKQDDGTWTPSQNMGRPINSKGHELCPFVSMDGKYHFYTSKQDIYWVSTKIFEQYRKE